jgi:hypothetical protein
MPDPREAADNDEGRRLAFVQALRVLRRRVQHLTSVPFDTFDRAVLGPVLDEIGRY